MIRLAEVTSFSTLEKLADEGGYTTLTAFVNENWKNLVEQKSIQVLNAHFSQDNGLGIEMYSSSDKKAKNSLKSR